jgi:hypothetical protein
MFLSPLSRQNAKLFYSHVLPAPTKCCFGHLKAHSRSGSDCMCVYGCGYADPRANIHEFCFFVVPTPISAHPWSSMKWTRAIDVLYVSGSYSLGTKLKQMGRDYMNLRKSKLIFCVCFPLQSILPWCALMNVTLLFTLWVPIQMFSYENWSRGPTWAPCCWGWTSRQTRPPGWCSWSSWEWKTRLGYLISHNPFILTKGLENLQARYRGR